MIFLSTISRMFFQESGSEISIWRSIIGCLVQSGDGVGPGTNRVNAKALPEGY
jgi:hypothetical protein